MSSLYEALGVDKDACHAEIQRAWRSRLAQIDPAAIEALPEVERESARHQIRQVFEAYEVLKNSHKRKQYDRSLEYAMSAVAVVDGDGDLGTEMQVAGSAVASHDPQWVTSTRFQRPVYKLPPKFELPPPTAWRQDPSRRRRIELAAFCALAAFGVAAGIVSIAALCVTAIFVATPLGMGAAHLPTERARVQALRALAVLSAVCMLAGTPFLETPDSMLASQDQSKVELKFSGF